MSVLFSRSFNVAIATSNFMNKIYKRLLDTKVVLKIHKEYFAFFTALSVYETISRIVKQK